MECKPDTNHTMHEGDVLMVMTMPQGRNRLGDTTALYQALGGVWWNGSKTVSNNCGLCDKSQKESAASEMHQGTAD